MRIEHLLILSLVLIACSCGVESNSETSQSGIVRIDTLYFTDEKDDQYFKAPFIRLSSDSGQHESVKIKMSVDNNLYVSVINYPGYPIYLKNLKNIELKNSYPDKGLFIIVAIDSMYQFDIFMDFGEGNALMKFKPKNSKNYSYKAYDGLRFIGRVSEKNFSYL